MKKTIISALIAITLFSCKKTPQRIVTENPLAEPIPCKVVFYTQQKYTYIDLTVNGSKFTTTQVTNSQSCDEGFNMGFTVGKTVEYSYVFNGGTSTGKGSLLLNEGCNLVELK